MDIMENYIISCRYPNVCSSAGSKSMGPGEEGFPGYHGENRNGTTKCSHRISQKVERPTPNP